MRTTHRQKDMIETLIARLVRLQRVRETRLLSNSSKQRLTACPAPACEALMTTKPSERIVVFVTPAQKLAITNTAECLGISVSELMRRAVMSFNATSEQVKVAGLVDRLAEPKTPDLLNVALRQVAERAAAREAHDAALAAKQAARRSLAAEPPVGASQESVSKEISSGDDFDASDEDASFSGRP